MGGMGTTASLGGDWLIAAESFDGSHQDLIFLGGWVEVASSFNDNSPLFGLEAALYRCLECLLTPLLIPEVSRDLIHDRSIRAFVGHGGFLMHRHHRVHDPHEGEYHAGYDEDRRSCKHLGKEWFGDLDIRC